MLNGDRAIAPLIKAIFVICSFLAFGMILSSVVNKKDEILAENEHKSAIRISLVREEYERKMGDLRLKYRQACEQKVQEIMDILRKDVKESEAKQIDELNEKYLNELKNQSNEIERLKEEVKRLTNTDTQKENSQERQANVGKNENQLAEFKSKLSQVENSKTKQPSKSKDEAKLHISDKDLLNKVSKELDEMEKKLEIT